MFSTTDGYSLDVFVVDGWPVEVHLSSSIILLSFTLLLVLSGFCLSHDIFVLYNMNHNCYTPMTFSLGSTIMLLVLAVSYCFELLSFLSSSTI